VEQEDRVGERRVGEETAAGDRDRRAEQEDDDRKERNIDRLE